MTSPFNGDISICFGFNEGTRALLGLLKDAFSLGYMKLQLKNLMLSDLE